MTSRKRATVQAPPDDRGHRRLEVLYDVMRRLAAVHETDEVLALIVNEATRLLGVEAAGLRLLEGDELVLKARTESAAAIMSRVRIKIGESLSGIAVARGEPVVVEDLAQDSRYDPAHKRAAMELGFHGFLGVPLRAHGAMIGALNVYTKNRRRFLADEISLLTAFADQASLAIEKDRLLSEAKERAERLRALARLNQIISSSLDAADVLGGIARAAAELMRAPAVGFWTADEAAQTLELRAFSNPRLGADFPARVLPFGRGGPGWVAVHRRALDIPDVAADDREVAGEWFAAHGLTSVYAVPILFQGTLLGVLGLFGDRPFRLGRDEQDLLESFEAQAAVAIRNARLFEEARVAHERLEHRTRDLDLLNRMGELLQACVTEEEAYSVFGGFIGQFFPQDPGAVFVTSASRNLVEAQGVWGGLSMEEAGVFKPDECWALRRGRMHVIDSPSSGLACKHLPSPPPAAYLCIPLMAQGEALGVLYLGTPSANGPGASAWSEAKQRLAMTVADQLGLAVANLKLRQTLRNQSIRDPLTTLFNRRYMEETLERELRRGERNRGSLGVIMLDLDHFKQFNDTFGHAAGDLLLRDLGPLLRANVRAEDVACRYGGEEFVLILPEASLESTRLRAEHVREAAKRLSVSYRGQIIGNVTLSLGVAAFPEHGTDAETLLKTADTALYRAKSEGRDRVALAESP